MGRCYHTRTSSNNRAARRAGAPGPIFPIRRRGPRGVPRITLTLAVDPAGAGRLSLAEDGTDNALAVPLAPVAVG